MSATGSVALGLLLAFAAACGVAIGLLLRRERRRFAAQGKARSWARVRLASAAILAITAASVVLPARQVSGMEALAVFYGLLFTLAPLLWFGLHWLAGRSVTIPVSGSPTSSSHCSGRSARRSPAWSSQDTAPQRSAYSVASGRSRGWMTRTTRLRMNPAG